MSTSNWARMLILSLCCLLAGCSSGSSTNVTVVPASASASNTTGATPASSGLSGMVQSGVGAGNVPINGAVVTLFEATASAPSVLGRATTTSSGTFIIPTFRATTSTTFYVTADLPNGVQFMSVLGATIPASITVDELTTVAAAYSMTQFLSNGLISGNSVGLSIAALTNANLVAVDSGDVSTVMLTSPNADQTNSLRSMRSLGNLLAAIARGGGIGLSRLYGLTTLPGGAAPQTLAQALADLNKNPAQNVTAIYGATQASSVFAPALTQSPDAWTLVVKVNDSGNDNDLFGGPANLVFDKNGFAWITNNTIQGQPISGMFNVVLQPNGQPANGQNGTPLSPLLGGGTLGAGFGIDIDASGNVWIGNFGWGQVNPGPTSTGSVSEYTALGVPLSGDNGYQGQTDRVQAVKVDSRDNVWLASFGNDRVVIFPDGNPSAPLFYQEPKGSGPFDLHFASDGSAWVTNSGGLSALANSNVSRYVLNGNALTQVYSNDFGHALKGFCVDPQGNVWIASGGDNVVYVLNSQGNMIGSFGGGGMDHPWSTELDGDGNIWVANFGPMRPGNTFPNAAVTRLAGANPATRPQGLAMGDPISPPTGYTLPSAGDPVLLHNGTLLYGPNSSPAYTPLQRVTAVRIDQGGNLWAINNWKNDLNADVTGNPGGDGICIFVGLAPPPKAH